MSKERARAREARLAAREAEKQKAARVRGRRQRVQALRPPALRKRRPRYGAMPLRQRLALAAGFFAVQFVGWQVLEGASQRLGLFLLSLLALPLVVTLYFSPRSSR